MPAFERLKLNCQRGSGGFGCGLRAVVVAAVVAMEVAMVGSVEGDVSNGGGSDRSGDN